MKDHVLSAYAPISKHVTFLPFEHVSTAPNQLARCYPLHSVSGIASRNTLISCWCGHLDPLMRGQPLGRRPVPTTSPARWYSPPHLLQLPYLVGVTVPTTNRGESLRSRTLVKTLCCLQDVWACQRSQQHLSTLPWSTNHSRTSLRFHCAHLQEMKTSPSLLQLSPAG